MDDILFKIIDLVMSNGQYTIVALLILVIMYFYKNSTDMQKRVDKKDKDIMDIIKKYQEGTLTNQQFMVELRKALVDIKNRL